MKNFRKVLALVLVVATLFSFTAMASAKSLSDYTDKDSVNYAPAVDILSTLGILNGYEDDSFKPANTITREEMAKMIAVLANSGSDVSTLYATACTFADVAKDHWSASYVAYCAKTGIVAGRSATTFDPKGKVTGLETAKMLLVTMGFDAEKQGYVGSDWKVNVLRDAKNAGLLGNFAASYDVDAAITREEAAQMMLNALNAQVVIGYVSNNIVTITNTAYSKWNGTLIDATKLSSNKWALYGNAIIAEDTLAKALYGTSFSKQAAHDCFGRPGFYWSFTNSKKLETSDEVFFAETVDYTYTTAVNFQNVLKNEKASSITYKTDVYVDGKLTAYASLTAAWDALKVLAGQTGKGVQTEIYVNDADAQITIVIINTYIGVVEYATKNAQTFQVNGLKASNKPYGFEEGDVVLYWVCNGTKAQYTATLHEAALAETAVGLATRATTVSGNAQKSDVTVDGKVYEYALNFGKYSWNQETDIPMGVEEVGASTNYGTEYILYLDKFGYIMAWEVAPVAVDLTYAYAVEYTGFCDVTGVNGNETTRYNAARDMAYYDNSYVEDVALTLNAWNSLYAFQAGYYEGQDHVGGTTFGRLIGYAKDGAGRAVIKRESVVLDGSYALKKNGQLTDGTNTIYSSSKTKYMVRTWDYTNKTDVYTVYSYGELPSSFTSVTGNVQYLADLANGNPNLTYASYIFFDAGYAMTSQRAFVVSYKNSVTDDKFVAQIGAYDAYTAVIDGKEAILAVTRNDNVIKDCFNADGTICGLFTLNLQVLGLDDNGTPVYAAAKLVDVDAYVALRIYNEQLQYKNEKTGKWVSVALDENAFGVAAHPASYTYDGGKTYVEFKILEDVNAIMDYYESKAAMDKADASELFFPGAAWIIDADGDGDIDEVYFNVYDGVDNYGIAPYAG